MKKIAVLLLGGLLVFVANKAIAQQTGKIGITLNKTMYNKGDELSAIVTFGVIAPMYTQYIVFECPETGDVESLELKNLSSQKLSTQGSLKILIGLRPVKNDGKLMVKTGGKIMAYYYKKDLNGAQPATIITKSKTELVTVSAAIRAISPATP